MSTSFKLFGKGLAEELIRTVSSPLAGLLIAMGVTALIQSSSTTTAIIVTLVAAGQLSIPMAIPMVMGANIGTTVTSTIVAFGHVTRKVEFRRAFTVATMHDLFNIFCVIILFPVEMKFHIIQKTATAMEQLFLGFGGAQLMSPLKIVIKPIVYVIQDILNYPLLMLIVALIGLFVALHQIVKTMKSIIINKVEVFFDRFLFRHAPVTLLIGAFFTVLVQSSSVAMSLIVPMAGAGIITPRKIFPYTLGANLGTTITAILASFATMNPLAIIVAFSHVIFNFFGMLIFYPLRGIPIRLAEFLGEFSVKAKKNIIFLIIFYSLLFYGPLVFFLLRRAL